MLYNIHTHFKPRLKNEVAIRNAYLKLFEPNYNNYYTSVGVHPWLIDELTFENQLDELRSVVAGKKVLAIGECGIDKLKGVDLALQLYVFTQHIKLANQLNKPLILHVVKAYNHVLELLKLIHVPVILHNYKGSLEQTSQLLKYPQVYFSFGSNMVKTPANYVDLLNKIAANRIFLETDNKQFFIDDIYDCAALLTKKSLNYWVNQIEENFNEVFKIS